ncbi:IPT/TIG domain-containing protein [Amycolatopsis sp. cmx-4-68]|uniref:IPT/TIG domain-containing protein n=1 Tax=Amycolatopsis sp. cmx-4-68 TaxID=2790938 RepID=UPI00397C81BA
MTVSSAATITAMQAIPAPAVPPAPAIPQPQADDVVEVAGYRSSYDGGGGTFFFETTRITGAAVRSVDIAGATTFHPGFPSPIVLTAARHEFVSGQAVLVEGNPHANGAWWVECLDDDRFALLGSQGHPALTSGGTAKSLTVTTSGPHRLALGGRAVIDRVAWNGGFSLNGTWMNIGMGKAPESFTLALAPAGTYRSGGVVGDGGLSVHSTAVDGRWVRRRDGTELDVKWFGAVGDGEADDTEAVLATIRAARAARTGVHLPGGDFKVTMEIKLQTHGALAAGVFTDLGMSIRGEGAGRTTLRAARTGIRSILSIDAHQVTVTGIRFDCAGHADHGLYLQGASSLHLDDVNVEFAVKDAYRVVRTKDSKDVAAGDANNDNVYARGIYANHCGTMYCSDSVKDRYGALRATTLVDGTVSCTKNDTTIIGSGTDFGGSIPARAGDFILIGANDDSTLQRLEIAEVVGPRELRVHRLGPPSLSLSGQPFAIGVGDGWSEETHHDNNRTRMDVGKITACAGSGVVCRGSYGPIIENMEFYGCGFAGIVIGTLDHERGLFFNTRIASPYFEATPFYGGCIFLAQARGITIDQPMWFSQPDHRRLVLGEVADRNSGIIGFLAEYPPLVNTSAPGGGVGLHPIGSSTSIDVPATRGTDFTNAKTFMLPSAETTDIHSSPWTETIKIPGRTHNIAVNRGIPGAPADVRATPTFPVGADGQELAICNTGIHPVTFHDGREPALPTGLVLDCEPGGSVSLGPGQIMLLYYSIHGSMNGRWTQQGAIGISVPILSSLDGTVSDPAGGDLITITGTHLANATSVHVGAVPVPAAAFTANTATSLTFPMPPTGVGTHNVLVTTGRGVSNVVPIEAWSPAQISGIDGYFDSRKGVTVAGSDVVTWTEQSRGLVYMSFEDRRPTKIDRVFGSRPAIRFAKPGAPHNAQCVKGPTLLLPNGSSVFWVGNWASTDTTATQTPNVPLTVVGDLSAVAYTMAGAKAGELRHSQYTGAAYTLTDRGSGLNDGTTRLVGWTHATNGDLKAYVGTTQRGATATGIPYFTQFNGWNAVGGGYGGDNTRADDGFEGNLGAVIIVNGVLTGTDMAKLHTWSRAGFRAA